MYHKHYSTKETPQSEPIPGSTQVENSTGGYTWEIDDWARLDRFLLLGASGGSYYASEQNLTVENAEAVARCIQEDGSRVVATCTGYSQAGRAAKNNPALFVLAMCASTSEERVRQQALRNLPVVARTGTHLFTFLTYVQAFRGWGRGLREAVARWYTLKNLDDLAYQLIKYRQRGGWTHRDVLRKAHPKSETHNALFNWVTQGEVSDALPKLVDGYITAQDRTDPADIADLVHEYNLPREAIPTEFLKDKRVWEALLEKMPMTALIRNLGNLGKVGALIPGQWDTIAGIVSQLGDVERIHKARIHPINVLSALVTYSQGQGFRGSGTWKVVPQVVEALDKAFYIAFDNVEPTNKRWVLGLDVSGSMTYAMDGIPGLSCRLGAAAMAMLTARTEERHTFIAFSSQVVPFPISQNERLDDIAQRMGRLPFGRTDCAQPMLWALDNKIEADMFVVYTDNETWYGDIHPVQALQKYRRQTGIQAKLAVVGMESNGFSIADPNDAGMMDFVGFDTATPQALSQFAIME